MFLNVPLSCQYQHFVAVVIVYKSRGSRLTQDSCLNFLGASLDLLVSPWMFVSSPGSPISQNRWDRRNSAITLVPLLALGETGSALRSLPSNHSLILWFRQEQCGVSGPWAFLCFLLPGADTLLVKVPFPNGAS